MEIINSVLAFFSCVAAFLFAMFVVVSVSRWHKLRRIGNASYGNDDSVLNFTYAWLIRNGVAFLKRPSSFLIKNKSVGKFIDKSLVLVSEKYDDVSGENFLSFLLLLSLVLCCGSSFLFWSPACGVAVMALFFVCLITYVNNKTEINIAKLRGQVPETLRHMSSCFAVGHTVYQTFQQISNESRGEISKIFKHCVNSMKSGQSISQSLEILESFKELPELSFIAIALDIQHKTGGSIEPLIDSAKDMATGKIELMEMLKTQTAQAKLSARIVFIMPFALVAVFSILSPGFLMPFLSSFLGIVLLVIACLMQAAGIILVKKMLDIKL